MSNYIQVDHSKFETAAVAIDNYVSTHKSNMKKADGEITTLSIGWLGDDYNQFKVMWNRLDDNDSTSQKMISAMENYAQFIRYASGKYKDAQVNAVNRANGISRW